MIKPLKNSLAFRFFDLFYRGFAGFRWQIVLLVILSVFGGILEGVGINTLIPLFSLAIQKSFAPTDFISRSLKRFFDLIHLNFSLKYLLIFAVLLFVARSIMLIAANYIRVRISAEYETATRDALLKKSFKASWPHLLRRKMGDLETVILTNARISSLLLDNITTSIMVGVSLLVYIVVAFSISVPVTLFTAFLSTFSFLVIQPLITRTRKLSRDTDTVHYAISHYINEIVLGMKTIKALAVEEEIGRIGQAYFMDMQRLRIKVALLRNAMTGFTQPLGLIFICLVFSFSYTRPGFSFASFVAIMYLIQRIFVYSEQMSLTFHAFGERVPSLEAVLNYFSDIEKNTEENQGREKFVFNDQLKFNQVFFNYGAEKTVLEGADFSIKKGQLVGLIGPSGAGKTTIVDLMLRLFVPIGGAITIDGKESSRIDLNEWRRHIGYVSQDIFLRNDTIAENIRFYNDSISDEQVLKAAEMANLSDFIANSPNGINTVVGERGVLLSAGQRQRICLARVLAREASVLILDEATSALDNESEFQIQEVIKRLKGKVTVFIIAHRLSTIINVDHLIAIEQGKVLEQGAPQTLLRDKQSYFYKVFNMHQP